MYASNKNKKKAKERLGYRPEALMMNVEDPKHLKDLKFRNGCAMGRRTYGWVKIKHGSKEELKPIPCMSKIGDGAEKTAKDGGIKTP